MTSNKQMLNMSMFASKVDYDAAMRKQLQEEMNMQKPVVHYSEVGSVSVGFRTLVKPIDHFHGYATNGDWNLTSEVISYDEKTGELETRNTIYVKHVDSNQ